MAATGDEAEKPKKKKKRQQAGVAAADGSLPDGSLLCFRVSVPRQLVDAQ